MRGFLNQIQGAAKRRAVLWPVSVLAGLSVVVLAACLITVVALEREANAAARQLAGNGWDAADSNVTPPALTAMHQAQIAFGYEGFLGDLQRFIAAPSLQGAKEMRNALTSAQQAIMTLGTFADTSGTDLRLPAWQAVLTLYQQALGRVEQSLGSGQTPDPVLFLPLYNAQQSLAALSAETEGALRARALGTLQSDNDMLRRLVWFVLGISLLLVAASWLTLRQAYVSPLQTLANALAGPGRLNPNTRLWGVERDDAIGEVARGAEALRQQLLATPDLAVSGADGEVQFLTFGGSGQNSGKAIFDALIARLAEAASAMQAADVPTTLENVEALCRALANTVQLTHEDLARAGSAIEATSAALADHSSAHDARLTQLTEALETRTSTVAEIAKMTGATVQGSLKEIVGAQMQMKLAAGQSASLFTQYGSKIEEMSERMSAATGLLRSGGKVLQETVDSVRTRMMDATSALTQTDARLSAVIEENRQRLNELAQQAQTVLARGGEGQAALSELTAASERIVAVATRLSGAEGDLTAATQAITAQSSHFAPLAQQLETLHRQLAEQVGQQITQQLDAHSKMLAAETERQQVTLARIDQQLDQQATRLVSAASALEGANFAPVMGKLEGLAQLTDGLSALLVQMQQIAPQLATFDSGVLNNLTTVVDRVSSVDLGAMAGLKEALNASMQATEMNTLRLNANLQLVQSQITDLLTNMSGGQAQLLPHIETMQRAVIQLRQQRATDVDEIEASVNRLVGQMVEDLGSRIDGQYQTFTGSLTGFITRFEQALAAPESTPSLTEEAKVPASARAILDRLRGGEAATAPAAATAETSLKDAIGRMSQIKQLTGALSAQTRTLTEVALGSELSADPAALAEQAKTLINEVMEAISDLSAAASTITETADRLDRQA